MTENIYRYNDIMRVIGYQNSCSYIDADFNAVLEAHKAAGKRDNDTFSVAIDFFLLGLICGRRRERADRNRREYKPLKKELEQRAIAAEITKNPELLAIYESAKELDPQQLAYLINMMRAQQAQEV